MRVAPPRAGVNQYLAQPFMQFMQLAIIGQREVRALPVELQTKGTKITNISAGTNVGPRSHVFASATLRSAPQPVYLIKMGSGQAEQRHALCARFFIQCIEYSIVQCITKMHMIQ